MRMYFLLSAFVASVPSAKGGMAFNGTGPAFKTVLMYYLIIFSGKKP